MMLCYRGARHQLSAVFRSNRAKVMRSSGHLEIDCLPVGCSILAEIDCRRHGDSQPHCHPHGEFYVVHEGHIVSMSENARWLIPAGQAYWVPAGRVHGGTLVNASGIRLYVAPAMTGEDLPDAPVAFSATPLIRALMDRWGEMAERGQHQGNVDRDMVGVLAAEINRSITRPVILPLPMHPSMRGVMSAWAETCEERVGLDQLAERCGMSRRTFTRQFRLETGMSPGNWMQAARILRGHRLMASGVSVTETAYMLGYGSPSSFFNLCRKLTGMNPNSFSKTT